MYAKPHVELVGGESKETTEEAKEKPKEESNEDSEMVMVEDYLGRNTNVVIKNIQEDKLGLGLLKNLLKSEESDKKRDSVIKAIQNKLKN